MKNRDKFFLCVLGGWVLGMFTSMGLYELAKKNAKQAAQQERLEKKLASYEREKAAAYKALHPNYQTFEEWQQRQNDDEPHLAPGTRTMQGEDGEYYGSPATAQ